MDTQLHSRFGYSSLTSNDEMKQHNPNNNSWYRTGNPETPS